MFIRKVLKTSTVSIACNVIFKSKVSVYPDHTCCLGHCRLRVFNSAVLHAQRCADRSVVDVTARDTAHPLIKSNTLCPTITVKMFIVAKYVVLIL